MNIPTEVSLQSHRGSTALSPKREINRLLSLSMLFSCLLVLVRIVHTGRITFLTLIWNLLLAYIPYFMTAHAGSQWPGFQWCRSQWRGAQWRRRIGGKLRFGLFFGCWLLFIPNTFYILTDLFHLNDRFNDRLVPQWYDLVLILSFAWNGLLLGVLSIRKMENILAPEPDGVRFAKRQELLFLYPIMWLNALGVYIGRYLRYNSWDVVTNPFDLFRDIARMVVHPLRHQYAWDMIGCFSILLTFMYLVLRRISDGDTYINQY